MRGLNLMLALTMDSPEIMWTDHIFVTDSDGDTKSILHLAAYFGAAKTVKYLCETKGISVNVVDSQGLTPLHYASICDASFERMSNTVEVLVLQGADLNAKSKMGHTPLEYSNECRIDDLFVKSIAPFVGGAAVKPCAASTQ